MTAAHGHVIQHHNDHRTLVCLVADGRHRAVGDDPLYAEALAA
ncbi:hypothetical protein [Aquibium microcysteis]|nr:hypothetical protein [Aquibium microcysteis]